MNDHIICNTLYFLQKCQLLLSQIEGQQEWINEINECQKELELHKVNHPLYEYCLLFITEKIIQPFLQDLDTLFNCQDVVKEIKKYELNFNYVIKRLSLIKEFIPNVVKVPLDDLFCKPQTDDEWIQLNRYIEFVNLDDPQSLSKQFDQFYDYIAMGAAYCTLGQKYSNTLISLIVQNVGGAAMLIKKQTARNIKTKEITNPSLSFVKGLWSIQNNSTFFKNFMKLTNCKIKSHLKIHVPFLFDDQQFKYHHDKNTYVLEKFYGFKMVDDLYHKLQVKELLQKSKQQKIKVRIISANKVILNYNIDYSQLVQKIIEISSEHHQISQIIQQNNKITKIKKVVLHIHGGGWVAMSSFSHQSYTRKWANYLGDDAIIFSIDYRLAPEYRYPYALEDVWQLYLWIINFSQFYLNITVEQIVLAGDSAGGNMALGVCFRAIKYGIRIPDGLLMAYPAVNLDLTKFNPYLLQGLIDQVAPATVLKLALHEYLKDTNGKPNIDPYLSPLIADDSFLLQLPKMTIMCGQLDSLTGDTIKFVNRLRKLNKQFRMIIYNGINHGFLNFEVPIFAVPAIKPLIENSCDLLKQLFNQ
ncbi:unnamed protein product [Paramecium pentaurelia]|uniref:Alpha/beta hydrolase fold-3 domain-containing protein n=1 Tax=Paramecium pentaurelia TaxID=43138 RepID=A0A8S1UZR7_9CILI|nr:unnamed protein product [Paramecium pentaurelia]